MIRPFNWWDFVYLLQATEWTILLSVIAFVGGGIVGAATAAARLSRMMWLRWLASGYIQVFQGTPLLIQLFVVFFLPSYLDLQVSALAAACFGLSLNAGAFLGEVWRAAIQSVSRHQTEAGKALGLHRWQIMRLIVLPQATRVAIPPTVGFMVQMVKATSLTAIIGFTELTRAGQVLINSTYQPFRIFLIITAIYFALCWPIALVSRWLEQRLNPAT
jgi:polar amino acid transport system permease protein